jgi:hypothetical protein
MANVPMYRLNFLNFNLMTVPCGGEGSSENCLREHGDVYLLISSLSKDKKYFLPFDKLINLTIIDTFVNGRS